MQTAASEPDEMLEGIKAGVYYYLTKPYEQEMCSASSALLRRCQPLVQIPLQP
jgi:DNA-binding response OmpR family regulator